MKSREGRLIPFPYLRAACFHPSQDKHLLISLRLSCLVHRMWPFWKSSLCLCVPSWMPDAEEKMPSLPPRNSLGKRFNWCSGKVKMPHYKSVPSELALHRPLEKIKLIKASKVNLMHWKGLLISVFGMMMSSSQRCINSWPVPIRFPEARYASDLFRFRFWVTPLGSTQRMSFDKWWCLQEGGSIPISNFFLLQIIWTRLL